MKIVVIVGENVGENRFSVGENSPNSPTLVKTGEKFSPKTHPKLTNFHRVFTTVLTV
ncbi:MAG: hypothetical protein HUK22_02605 [Thermoguttaceae bacterium]|nr:hypothetical protein [Thermoguttaceae bacterium]